MRNATPNEKRDPMSPEQLRKDAAGAMDRLRESIDPKLFTPALAKQFALTISSHGVAAFADRRDTEMLAWMAATAVVYPLLADIIEKAEGKP